MDPEQAHSWLALARNRMRRQPVPSVRPESDSGSREALQTADEVHAPQG